MTYFQIIQGIQDYTSGVVQIKLRHVTHPSPWAYSYEIPKFRKKPNGELDLYTALHHNYYLTLHSMFLSKLQEAEMLNGTLT